MNAIKRYSLLSMVFATSMICCANQSGGFRDSALSRTGRAIGNASVVIKDRCAQALSRSGRWIVDNKYKCIAGAAVIASLVAAQKIAPYKVYDAKVAVLCFINPAVIKIRGWLGLLPQDARPLIFAKLNK